MPRLGVVTTWRAEALPLAASVAGEAGRHDRARNFDQGRARRFRLGEDDREPFLVVGPFADQAPAARRSSGVAANVAVLGVDGLARPEAEAARPR